MNAHPDLATIAALIGNPARAAMLSDMLGGMALTATELSVRAGVAPSTTSEHLDRLVDGGLICLESQGRHRYYRLAHPDVAHLLEALGAYAPASGHTPRIPAELRFARTCYDHLAGHLGVAIRLGLIERGVLVEAGAEHRVTVEGERWFAGFGVDVESARRARRSFAGRCLDWSERRPHIAGALGAVILQRLLKQGWVTRLPGERAITLTPDGERGFGRELGLDLLQPTAAPRQ